VKCVYPRDFDGDTKAEFEARQIKHGASPEPDPSLPTYGYPVALMGTFLGYGSTGIMGHGDDEEMRLFSTYAVPEKDVRVGLGAVDRGLRHVLQVQLLHESHTANTSKGRGRW
jgi:hypothetical protein